MTVCFMQQEMVGRLGLEGGAEGKLDDLLEEVQALLSKVR
jgi:hypothetical protein